MREALGADPPGLLERLRAGEPRAFEELVTVYQHRVFGVALRMLGSRAEAEEIAQEVFLRAYRAVADFRGDARLGTWLYGIASRLCLNRLASPDRRVARGDAALADVPASTPDAAAAAERAELDAALRAAIAGLPEDRRLVLVLRDVEGLSYEEIANALDLDPGTVRSRLHRARLQLKEKLERFA
ncbi:MAG TPA: sigma-70 family RNA polymerase sigma factor [Patescibacteria group bacterium]|nr:sigma-70 family RNA polymerase sigma factor [Patescibacteria group bacterium]